jgi:hypothetical protein
MVHLTNLAAKVRSFLEIDAYLWKKLCKFATDETDLLTLDAAWLRLERGGAAVR